MRRPPQVSPPTPSGGQGGSFSIWNFRARESHCQCRKGAETARADGRGHSPLCEPRPVRASASCTSTKFPWLRCEPQPGPCHAGVGRACQHWRTFGEGPACVLTAPRPRPDTHGFMTDMPGHPQHVLLQPLETSCGQSRTRGLQVEVSFLSQTRNFCHHVEGDWTHPIPFKVKGEFGA